MVKLRQLLSALLLCAALTLSAGCGNDTPPAAETDAGITAPTVRQIVLADKGISSYTLIRPEQADRSIINATIGLMHSFTQQLGATPKISDDWLREYKNGETVPADPTLDQIIIGETNRGETAVVRDGMDFAIGYRMQMVGNSLVILGTNDAMTIKAVEDFTAQYLVKSDTLALPENFSMTYNFAADTATGAGIMGKYRVLGSTLKSDFSTAATAVVKDALFYTESSTDVKPAIIVGENENFPSSVALADGLGYMDYTIKVSPEEILIVGGSPTATQRAAERFAELFLADAIGAPADGFTESWRFADVRPDSLIYRVDEFKPSWSDRLTIPDWMHDFDEKSYAITAANGRWVSNSHRGDIVNYPDNSLEGILSAILLGVDIIEIDVRLTADHIPVLMHDATLTRTTDVASKKGKDGLPTSDKIADWTYAQLMELNLTLNGKVTDYKIPTAYEAIALVAGRCFIHWDAKEESLAANDAGLTELFCLADDLGAKSSFYYYCSDATMQTWVNMDKDDTEFAAYHRTMQAYLARAGHQRARRNIEITTQNGEHAAGWTRTVEVDGRRCVFTNYTEALCTYIAQNQSPQTIPQ